MASVNHAYSGVSFVAFILVCIPIPWQVQCRNVGTSLIALWSALALFILFIDSIIWNGNALDSAPIWCEITTRLQIGAGIGIPAGALCLTRRLYHISGSSSKAPSEHENKSALISDLILGLGLPVLNMIFYYIIQGNRYDIYEDFGCVPSITSTWMTLVLNSSWPLLIGLASCIYGVFVARSFLFRRQQLLQNLSNRKDLNTDRYFRLMALALTDILVAVPFSAFNFGVNIATGCTAPYNWDEVHYEFSTVYTFSSVIWKNLGQASVTAELSRWIFVIAALLFFGFFGLGEEAFGRYNKNFAQVSRLTGITRSQLGFRERNTSMGVTRSSSTRITLDRKVVSAFEDLGIDKHTSMESFVSPSIDLLSIMPEKLSPVHASSPHFHRYNSRDSLV